MQWGQMALKWVFTILTYKKLAEGNDHCALQQHTELWCCFCVISAFTLSCWLSHWLSQTLIKPHIIARACSTLFPLAAEGKAEFNTGFQKQWGDKKWCTVRTEPAVVAGSPCVCVHVRGLAFLSPQPQQMPAIVSSTKSGHLIWKKEIIYGEGYTKDTCLCFFRKGVRFFYDFSILHKCSGGYNIWDNM